MGFGKSRDVLISGLIVSFLSGTRLLARVNCTDGAMKVTLMKDFYLKKGGGLRLKPGTFVCRSLKSSSVGRKAIKKTFFRYLVGISRLYFDEKLITRKRNFLNRFWR